MYVPIHITVAIGVTVWFTLGGIRDVRQMLRTLATMDRDPTDDGRVRDRGVP